MEDDDEEPQTVPELEAEVSAQLVSLPISPSSVSFCFCFCFSLCLFFTFIHSISFLIPLSPLPIPSTAFLSSFFPRRPSPS